MNSNKRVFSFGIVLMTAAMTLSCFMRDAQAEPRGARAVEGPRGNVAVEGPRGNVAVGTRYDVLPASAHQVFVGGQTYYVDTGGIYYLPCDDDNTIYCVVAPPQ